MQKLFRSFLFVFLFFSGLITQASGLSWAAKFRYTPGRYGPASLRYVNEIPVLTVSGTPRQVGEQIGALAGRQAARLMRYPREFLERMELGVAWPATVALCRSMLPRIPRDYRQEMRACAAAAGNPFDDVLVANTIFDLKKAFACSTLIVEPERCRGRGPLFGRNLDFPTLGYLQDYSLVIVYRPQRRGPKGVRAFASVGFPGLVGSLSGMNEAGLALAVLEVYESADGSPRFDPAGTPYAMCFRRLLETCRTVDEALTALRAMRRTTMINLAVCDRRGGAVFEVTPRRVERRGPAQGLIACTNHFRTSALATGTACRRYAALLDNAKLPARPARSVRLGLAEVRRRLHAAHQGPLTLQTMIFAPASLTLHLALGSCPTSALPLKRLELAPLFHPPAAPVRSKTSVSER